MKKTICLLAAMALVMGISGCAGAQPQLQSLPEESLSQEAETSESKEPFFVPEMNAEQQSAYDQYVRPLLLCSMLMKNWSAEEYSALTPEESAAYDLHALIMAFEDITEPDEMQKLWEKYDGKFPEEVVDEVLLSHFAFTPEQLHALLADYYRADEHIYEYTGGRGGGPIEGAATGITKNEDGSMTIDYTIFTGYWDEFSTPEKSAYSQKTAGKLMLKPNAEGAYLYCAVSELEITDRI